MLAVQALNSRHPVTDRDSSGAAAHPDSDFNWVCKEGKEWVQRQGHLWHKLMEPTQPRPEQHRTAHRAHQGGQEGKHRQVLRRTITSGVQLSLEVGPGVIIAPPEEEGSPVLLPSSNHRAVSDYQRLGPEQDFQEGGQRLDHQPHPHICAVKGLSCACVVGRSCPRLLRGRT